MRMLQKFAGVVGMVAVFGLVSCGSDNDIVPVGQVGESASLAITAQDGGVVEVASKAAGIAIPAGALAADTTISINTLDSVGMADEDRLGSFVFDFGPDGTTFGANVTITLKTGGSTPSGKEAKLAWLDGDKWKEVPGSKEVDGKVVGDVNHFTKFVIYFTDKEVVIENGDEECKDLSFSACGGDPVGEWAIQAYCFDTRRENNMDNPYEEVPDCANGNSTFVVDIEWLGTINVNSDGTTATHMGHHAKMIATLNDKCLKAMGQGQVSAAQMCDVLGQQAADDGAEVQYKGGKCTITMDQGEDWDEPTTGTWEKVGNELRMNDDDETVPYCVSGNTLTVQHSEEKDTNDDGQPDVTYKDTMVLKRQ
ncbi:MAG TPA: hypothetical protein PKH54_04105 [Myxococcota bacterium]|nr:hypothetical protein [Myxococcota bacterium]HOH76619.1 hypothetical protein [Myxococcota bacterium]HPV03682.1 hypothetical protein [Myxococcota bacterium]